MRRHGVVLVAALALCMAATGCSTYWNNRVADFADIWTVEGTVGPGLDAHVQVTSLLGSAFGWSKQLVGLAMHGRFVGVGHRSSSGVIIMGSTDVQNAMLFAVYGDEKYEARSREWILFVRDSPKAVLDPSEWRRLLDVEAGVSVLAAGVHAGVSPVELLDFVFGFTTLDLCCDDKEEQAQPAPPAPEPAATPAPAPAPAAQPSGGGT